MAHEATQEQFKSNQDEVKQASAKMKDHLAALYLLGTLNFFPLCMCLPALLLLLFKLCSSWALFDIGRILHEDCPWLVCATMEVTRDYCC